MFNIFRYICTDVQTKTRIDNINISNIKIYIIIQVIKSTWTLGDATIFPSLIGVSGVTPGLVVLSQYVPAVVLWQNSIYEVFPMIKTVAVRVLAVPSLALEARCGVIHMTHVRAT